MGAQEHAEWSVCTGYSQYKCIIQYPDAGTQFFCYQDVCTVFVSLKCAWQLNESYTDICHYVFSLLHTHWPTRLCKTIGLTRS